MRHIDIIENGTVIDHVCAGMGRKILSLIGEDVDVVTIGVNLDSSQQGKKDIIKYANKQLTESELALIAAMSPGATINVVSEGKVIKKYKLVKPGTISGIIECPNPKCITNHEYAVTKFSTDAGIRCFYCERLIDPESISAIRRGN